MAPSRHPRSDICRSSASAAGGAGSHAGPSQEPRLLPGHRPQCHSPNGLPATQRPQAHWPSCPRHTALHPQSPGHSLHRGSVHSWVTHDPERNVTLSVGPHSAHDVARGATWHGEQPHRGDGGGETNPVSGNSHLLTAPRPTCPTRMATVYLLPVRLTASVRGCVHL